MVYYNEFESFAAEWLSNLGAAGHIPAGRVDTRSIKDVTPDDLPPPGSHCHFFAGLGGWAHALRLAGWPEDREVWTGSCPCQPYSSAGAGAGFDDPRHLWPDWFRLVRERRPGVIFGEQVASKAALPWLDLVRSDLEGAGYTFAAFDLCAAGVGAPHIRQRLWFVALRLADDDAPDWVPCTDGKSRPVEPGTFPLAHGVPARVGRLRAYGNAIVPQVAAEFIRSVMDVIGA